MYDQYDHNARPFQTDGRIGKQTDKRTDGRTLWL